MTLTELVATANTLGVSGLLVVAVLGVLRGEWVPGYQFRALQAAYDALAKDHAALRAEFDQYRQAHQ